MILDIGDFRGEASIPGMMPAMGSVGPNNGVVQANVREFIAKYEPKFLLMFYGWDADKADALEEYASLSSDRRTSRSRNRLLSALKEPLSYYVAFYYFRHCTVANTPIGGMVCQGENGVRNNTSAQTVRLWNDMADRCLEIYRNELREEPPLTEVFEHVNEMNL